MKKGGIAVTLILIFITSCNNNNYVPSGIIKPKQMQNLFWDMARGDVLAQEIIKKDSSKNIKSTNLAITEKIFLLYKIDREKFERSITYYEKHPALLRSIFDSLNVVKTRENILDMERRTRKEKEYHVPLRKKVP